MIAYFKSAFLLVGLVLLAYPSCGRTILVPEDEPTIQAGIDAAGGGDTVLVAPGVYEENIDFLGKSITVKAGAGAAKTSIKPLLDGSVVTFSSSETEEATLQGFTITGGTGTFISEEIRCGGGIYCSSACPTIKDCIITANRVAGGPTGPSTYGGGIYCSDASPRIRNCIILFNEASVYYLSSSGR